MLKYQQLIDQKRKKMKIFLRLNNYLFLRVKTGLLWLSYIYIVMQNIGLYNIVSTNTGKR
jgi:hypothetical protein